MNSQSAAQTDADERECSSPGEASSNTGADAKTSSKIMKSFGTKRLFFHFEIGVTSRMQPGFGADPQALQPVRYPASAQPVLVGAPKPQVAAFGPGAAGTDAPALSSADSCGPSYKGRSVYFDISAGVSDMPPGDPLGPPRPAA